MYINDRDEINYHGFLRATRERQNVSLRMVGEGICTESAISRVEIGDRLPEKLMRDRISARLGVSGEGATSVIACNRQGIHHIHLVT